MDDQNRDPRVERTRRRVVEAAVRLMLDGGPQAVTFSALSEASGVGRATLYRHWPTLESLWPEVLAESGDPWEFTPTGDAKTDLREALGIVALNVKSAEGRAGFAAMLERAQWDPETRRLADHAEQNSPVAQALAALSRSRRQATSADSAAATALLLGPLIYRALLGDGNLSDAFLDEVVETFLTSHPMLST